MLTNCLPILKKTAASKRTSMPRSADYAKAFLKDWQRLSHSGRYDMVRLKEAMMLLIANDEPLAPEWLDHALKGEWADHRECHIGGDFLLIYQIDDTAINFVRSGTHSELFE
jgi:mRNA interferase YafQ